MTDDGSRPGAATVRVDARAVGRVQGVGFRYHVVQRARELDLRGWVANEADGSVSCRAEGTREAVDALLATMEAGPAGALVDRVIVAFGPAMGDLPPFGIRSGAHRGD